MMRTSDGTVAWPSELAEKYQALGVWENRTLWEVFSAQAEESAPLTALVDGEVRLTYGQLSECATACASQLRAAGLQRDDRIIVQLPNGWQFVVLVLACFQSGIVPVMALPAHREHELRYLVDLSEAVAIAVPQEHRGFDHGGLARRLIATTDTLRMSLIQSEDVLQPFTGLPSGGPATHTDEGGIDSSADAPHPGDVALFLLSGGTTGLPKLIPRTHNDYVCNVRFCTAVSRINGHSVYLVTLPIGHNFPLACPGILGALFAGGETVILTSPEPNRAFATIASEGVTHAAAVPAVAQTWMEHAEEVGSGQLSSLRVLQVGGARIVDELAARIEPTLGVRLQQVFGMAEGLINMTRLDDPDAAIIGTQGRPVSDLDEIRIVDELGADVADGKRGVLLTRGPYTPRGYYRADEHNARAFTEGGWYVSGDEVRMAADGNLIVEGRSKDMINRGGESISAEEIENLVYRLPQVSLAAAVAMPDPRLGERICLFLQGDEQPQLTCDAIAAAFDSWGVAAFKKPERVVYLPELPLTKVGKIDKKALREWLAEHSHNELIP